MTQIEEKVQGLEKEKMLLVSEVSSLGQVSTVYRVLILNYAPFFFFFFIQMFLYVKCLLFVIILVS